MKHLRFETLLLIPILVVASVFAGDAKGQGPAASPTPQREAVSEADPTKPIFWVIRNEYRDLKNGGWANAVVVRHDRFFFRNLAIKGGAKGMVFRVDVPLNRVHRGTETKTGLGDIFTQVLFIPRITRKFAFSVGSGFTLPTATSDSLGQGKLIVAPVAVPLWYLAKRKRLIAMRVQQFISVAGKSNRPDVNFTVFDPLIGLALGRRGWLSANTEFKWDWKSKRGSGTTGVQAGHMISDRLGLWIKPEIPWGPGRTGSFNIKVGVLRYR